MSDRVYNVLFLCTHNSARSIMAEAYLNYVGANRFQAFSAGSFPSGKVNPLTLQTLTLAGLPVAGLQSKSWDVFAEGGAPHLDIVITVCDQAAGEVCPIWPGQPVTGHWSFPDPSAAQGSDVEKQAVFLDVFRRIRTRVDLLASLPMSGLDRLSLKRKIQDIGGSTPH